MVKCLVSRAINTGYHWPSAFDDQHLSSWVINNFCFLKATCNYAFQSFNVLNTTVNYLIKIVFLDPSYFNSERVHIMI